MAAEKSGGGLPSREELLGNLADARFDRSINVAAIKLLLEEGRRDEDRPSGSEFDELDSNVTPIRRSA